jgi:hypothetical protein
LFQDRKDTLDALAMIRWVDPLKVRVEVHEDRWRHRFNLSAKSTEG